MWAIVPAAGKGSRIQPLACSKELLPLTHQGRPRAVSDHLLDRLILGGAQRICLVISPGKSDILEYHGANRPGAALFYAVQPQPLGLCDAIFRALPVIDPRAPVLVGLPDTIWFPENALQQLPDDTLSFLLFPSEHPDRFDAVLTDEGGHVREIRVKQPDAGTKWIWGAFKMPGSVLQDLYDLWCLRDQGDEYIGTLVNAWLDSGGRAVAVRAGAQYYDIGTMEGYLDAMHVLQGQVDRSREDVNHGAPA